MATQGQFISQVEAIAVAQSAILTALTNLIPTQPGTPLPSFKTINNQSIIGVGNLTVTATPPDLSNYVTKESAKGLSSNDYTTVDKNKLSLIAVQATKNSTDALLRDRSTHTGTSPISSITGLETALSTLEVKDTNTITGIGSIKFWTGTEEEYTAINPKLNNVIYFTK